MHSLRNSRDFSRNGAEDTESLSTSDCVMPLFSSPACARVSSPNMALRSAELATRMGTSQTMSAQERDLSAILSNVNSPAR